MYCASSRRRACTLRLPSLVLSSDLSSLNVSDSFTASALAMPRRTRSWMTRSSEGVPSTGSMTRISRPPPPSRLRAAPSGRGAVFLATVTPRDQGAKDDVQGAEADRQVAVAPADRAEQRRGTQQQERDPHGGHDAHREGAPGGDPRAVEEQPDRGQPAGLRPVHERHREQRAHGHRDGEREDELAPGHVHERHQGGARLALRRPQADRQRDQRLGQPGAEPGLARGLQRRHQGGDQGGDAGGHEPPAGNGGECPRPLHGATDVAQVVDRLPVQREDVGAALGSTGRRRHTRSKRYPGGSVKYFVSKSEWNPKRTPFQPFSAPRPSQGQKPRQPGRGLLRRRIRRRGPALTRGALMTTDSIRLPERRAEAIAGILLLASTLAMIAAAQARAADRYTVRGSSVAIYSLVGRIDAEAGTGTDVVVEVTRSGADAAKLRVEQGDVGSWQTLRVIFPANHVTVRGGNFWGTDMRVGDDGRFNDGSLTGEESGRHKVQISSRTGGLEARADVRIQVPKGRKLALFLGVGSLSVTNVDGDLRVDVASADATVRGTRGPLDIDSGSGTIQVSDVAGEVKLDTGSGTTIVRGIRGDRLSLDTGSGGLTVVDAAVDVLNADSGSGSVEIHGLTAQEIALDSGSGSVRMSLLASAPRSIEIDSGSGGVTLTVPENLDASFELEAGSGGIDILVPHELTERSSDHMRGRFGNGKGHIHIDCGSGGVKIVPGKAAAPAKKGSTGKS